MLAGVGAGLVVARGHRKLALLSGLMLVPFALSCPIHVPRYWNPVRLGSIFRTGIEDLLAAFVTGALIWLLASPALRRRVVFRPQLRSAATRYLLASAAGCFFVFLLALAPWQLDFALFGASIALGALLLVRQPFLWRASLLGAVGFTVVYMAAVHLAVELWPISAFGWGYHNLCGIVIHGVPLEETAWSLAMGFMWPPFAGYVLGAGAAEPAGQVG
jgi:hypothetical protein